MLQPDRGEKVKYISVCSGIEAATVAWHPLGFKPLAFSEIEKFPRAVLQHHYPEVPLHGDFTTIGNEYGRPDILVGGTPCQSFSIAGLRKGMDDERGNLALEYLKLAKRLGPKWLVWENVPGVLSSWSGDEPPSDLEEGQEWGSTETSDFGCFLSGLQELGYGFAYRILDAQFYGVAQRRRRVFVIGYLGDWRPPAAVLFESESLSWNPPPSRKTWKGTPGNVAIGIDEECNAGIEKFGPLLRDGQGGAEIRENGSPSLTCNHESPIVAFAQNTRDEVRIVGGDGQIAGALAAEPGMKQQTYLCYENHMQDSRVKECGDLSPQINAKAGTGGGNLPLIQTDMQVRRLTPVECARLQGFPDHHCRIPWRGKPAEKCPDGPQYKAFGNSMAVPVMFWLGERIKKVEEIT